MPSTMLNLPGVSVASAPPRMCWPMSATLSSCAGSMPRSSAPRFTSPDDSIACPFTYGAVATTCGFFLAALATAAGSRRSGKPRISMCDATERMRLRSSCWKPFITDSTTISAATPSAMPAIEISAMNEMNALRPDPLRARV